MNNNFYQVQKFFELFRSGKQAAFDVNSATGEIVCQYAINYETRKEGNGTPGIPFPGDWVRAAECANGTLK